MGKSVIGGLRENARNLGPLIYKHLDTLSLLSLRRVSDGDSQAVDKYFQKNPIRLSKEEVETHYRTGFLTSVDTPEGERGRVALEVYRRIFKEGRHWPLRMRRHVLAAWDVAWDRLRFRDAIPWKLNFKMAFVMAVHGALIGGREIGLPGIILKQAGRLFVMGLFCSYITLLFLSTLVLTLSVWRLDPSRIVIAYGLLTLLYGVI